MINHGRYILILVTRCNGGIVRERQLSVSSLNFFADYFCIYVGFKWHLDIHTCISCSCMNQWVLYCPIQVLYYPIIFIHYELMFHCRCTLFRKRGVFFHLHSWILSFISFCSAWKRVYVSLFFIFTLEINNLFQFVQSDCVTGVRND